MQKAHKKKRKTRNKKTVSAKTVTGSSAKSRKIVREMDFRDRSASAVRRSLGVFSKVQVDSVLYRYVNSSQYHLVEEKYRLHDSILGLKS